MDLMVSGEPAERIWMDRQVQFISHENRELAWVVASNKSYTSDNLFLQITV